MSGENRKANSPAVLTIFIVIELGIVGLLYVFYGPGAPTPPANPLKGRVLMVELTDEPSEGWDGEAFSKALQWGGRIQITFKEAQSRYPEIEMYVVSSSKGTYFTTGAIINFITSKGWAYQGREYPDLVFVHN